MNPPLCSLLIAILIVLSSSVGLTAAGAVRKPGVPVEAPTEQDRVPSDSAAENKVKLEWNIKNLLDGYRRNGSSNAKWDAPAEKALKAYASSRAGSQTLGPAEMKAVCESALDAGCTDPMIRYLHIRAVAPAANRASKEQSEKYAQAAAALMTSMYSDLRKFYACARAAEAVFYAGGTNRETRTIANGYRRSASTYLETALKDETIPVTEAYDACNDELNLTYRFSQEYHYVFGHLEPLLVPRWEDNSSIQLLRGHYYINYAWAARGTGYANTVTDEGWKLMGKRLEIAEQALEKAWKLNPKDERIPNEMITLELGQGKGRDRMELWFNRGMQIWTNNYKACWNKAYYLEPKWYGSPEALLAFGRECVASTNWGGKVPLILVDAHAMLVEYLPPEKRADYWKQPEVWQDLKAAYEKFLVFCPDQIPQRQSYISRAYQNEKWEELNAQLKLLSKPNYEFFGGKVKFDEMVRAAQAHSGDSKK